MPAGETSQPDVSAPSPDLRLVLPAVAAWTGALVGVHRPAVEWLGVLAVLSVGGAVVWHRHRSRQGHAGRVLLALLACFGACATGAALRAAEHAANPVALAAQRHAYVTLTLRLDTDPVTRPGRFGAVVLVRGTTTTLSLREGTLPVRAPVLVLVEAPWRSAGFGAVVRVSGRLALPRTRELSAVLTVTRDPVSVRPPSALLRLAAAVRASIRAASAGTGPASRELVPALVVGDDAGLPEDVVDDFRTAGLTHLTAVSGTNLTLVVGFLLLLARWVGVRARGLVVVGIVGVVGFVLLARPEPSVLRAAVMGSVALLGLSTGGRERGVRALSVAVCGVMLLDPWLSSSVGFALSVLATAGILFLAPPLRDALSRWLPRWLAEAVAVPFSAQVACTPLVAAVSGAVSLVAVLANLLVAVVVGPATVLGLGAGLVFGVHESAGRALGRAAGWCADWIVLVAHRTSGLPTPAVPWSTGALGLALLTAASVAVALTALRVAARPLGSLACTAVLGLVLLRAPPSPGWPPDGWVLVACDVGQGDALVLNAGPRSAVVVDTGPDPRSVDRCLSRLGVRLVTAVLLTHFHADHVDGLPGVLRGRDVGEVDVTALREPASGAVEVDRWARAAAVPVRVPAFGEARTAGGVTWQVLAPLPRSPSGGPTRSEEGSAANNASLVLWVESRGVRFLLTGDVEPEAQAQLERTVGDLRVDVLKVPHHGSRYQDATFLSALGARLAVVSVGDGNDYGHPAAETLELLSAAGMTVRRTDRDGDVAILVRDGQLRVATSR